MTNKETIRILSNMIHDDKVVYGYKSNPRNDALDLAIKALEERPQSKWIDEGQYADYHSEHAYMCANCGWHIIESPDLIFENRFCKHCGAQMKGGAEND